MSYRVDIPTLSANEVYTLTFEYEGTETIQLIVGDLTLETTDRRVVFTTTSPVNYIESNVNLTNLNIYEGYYESDVFGGEYTQESYIEGMSLVNLIQSQKHLDFQNSSCGVETFEDNMIKLTITDASSLTSTWQLGWIKTSANLKVGATYTCVVHVVENTISTEGMTIGASYGTLVHGSASNSLGGGETGVVVFTYTTATATLKDYNGYYDGFCRVRCVGDWQNGSLKYGIMIFEGDYYDYFINSDIPYFEGIGCVKSPKIVSYTEDKSEESYVTTPDDLKMYELPTNWGDSHDGDRLDLTTDILTKKIENLIIDNATWSPEIGLGKVVPNSAGTHYECKMSYAFLRDTKYNGASNNAQKGIFFKNGCSLPVRVEAHYISMDIPISMLSEATIDNYLAFLDGGEIIYFLATHRTEQLSLNPLKSYRNGSIQTSSQQLTPTLKTTLPISNKFTTTNLTSGSTYNVYFDGTATKLDAGGTIITNPVSPCEVECGGTTLTIEGTDIQNVRVIETTVSNEVGSICGTTDVELSKVKTASELYDNYFDEYKHSEDYKCSSIRYDNKVVVTGTTGLCYSIYKLNSTSGLSKGTYKFHCKVKVQNIGDKYRLLMHSNPNNTANNTLGFAINPITSTKLIEEVNHVGYYSDANSALFYSYADGQTVEYYDISLIKLSDENITGTDIPSINYLQKTSTLEQPIKLRSLGTTYDSYNPVTGELIKRIGVSETDGGYSVLSSPIVSQVEIDNISHLYKNGQVKVYSDSEVYPTTILNGQSTNNYEVNELNKSNNYTIRYEGECESISLANKSNEQGTNKIVKTNTNGSGNLTFVNNSGDIDNVLLVQNDVREQEINHFNGLQTVEISRMLIENQGNMWWNDWITPSEYGASWQVDSPEFISVEPGETIYVIANNNSYTSLFEFDENYNIVNQGKDLILSNEANPKPIDLGNGYYKNYRVLSENTRYIKFTIPAGTASTAKSETRWSIISFTKTDVGNVPLYTNNTPYRGSIINLPQPVQLNSLPDGTCDTYNPITGEYVQNVGYVVYDDTTTWNTYAKDFYYTSNFAHNEKFITYHKNLEEKVASQLWTGDSGFAIAAVNLIRVVGLQSKDEFLEYMKQYPLQIIYGRKEPITTQLTPITIPTFEGGIVQLITTDGKVFPMIEYSMPTNNRYDTSSWEAGKVYTQRNMTEAYFNESTTPMTPTETMTLTTDHISSGSIILNDNGNGLIVLKGNYTGRDIPYFTGMRSVEAIEVETTPSPDQPLFGKGGRR